MQQRKTCMSHETENDTKLSMSPSLIHIKLIFHPILQTLSNHLTSFQKSYARNSFHGFFRQDYCMKDDQEYYVFSMWLLFVSEEPLQTLGRTDLCSADN